MMETPGVLAFLNGCDLRSALRGQVLLAKMFGTILAVGGGLALGPEGWRGMNKNFMVDGEGCVEKSIWKNQAYICELSFKLYYYIPL